LTRARRKARHNARHLPPAKSQQPQRHFLDRGRAGQHQPGHHGAGGRDYVTTQSFQFTADIAAVGPFGRGYRRVKFIFDISEGTPKIIYRQDLSRLGWALGEKARTTWVAKETQ
jgi:hypothetical protein